MASIDLLTKKINALETKLMKLESTNQEETKYVSVDGTNTHVIVTIESPGVRDF